MRARSGGQPETGWSLRTDLPAAVDILFPDRDRARSMAGPGLAFGVQIAGASLLFMAVRVALRKEQHERGCCRARREVA